jgi:hypothetical protein
LPMTYIYLGKQLWRPYKPQKQRNKMNFPRHKKHADVERAFGVLKDRVDIVHGQTRFWDKKPVNNIITVCGILQHMIIENENKLKLEFFYDNVGNRVKPQTPITLIQACLEMYRKIEDSSTHTHLNLDLIRHHRLHGKKRSPSFIHFLFIYLFMCEMNNYLPSKPFIIC